MRIILVARFKNVSKCVGNSNGKSHELNGFPISKLLYTYRSVGNGNGKIVATVVVYDISKNA